MSRFTCPQCGQKRKLNEQRDSLTSHEYTEEDIDKLIMRIRRAVGEIREISKSMGLSKI